MIQLIWEMLWPVALYEVITEICRLFLSEYGSLTVQTVSAVTASVIFGVLYRRAFGIKENREEKSVNTLRTGIGSALIFLCIAGISSSLLCNNLVTLSGIKDKFTGYKQVNEVLYSPSLWLQVLGMGIAIPAAEELIFRGFIYGSLRKRYSFWIAAIASSVLFGCYHGNMAQGIYACAIACVLAYSYECYGRLWSPWVVHGSANLTSVLAGKWMVFEDGRAGGSFLFVTMLSGACLIYAVCNMKIKEVSQ